MAVEYNYEIREAIKRGRFERADDLLAEYEQVRHSQQNFVMVALHYYGIAHEAMRGKNRDAGLEWLLGLDHFGSDEERVKLAVRAAGFSWPEGVQKALGRISDLPNATRAEDLTAIIEEKHEASALAAIEMGMPWQVTAEIDNDSPICAAAFQNMTQTLRALQEKGADLHKPVTTRKETGDQALTVNLLFIAAIGNARNATDFLLSEGLTLSVPDLRQLVSMSVGMLRDFPFLYFEMGGEINYFSNDALFDLLCGTIGDNDSSNIDESLDGLTYLADHGYDLRPIGRRLENEPEFREEFPDLSQRYASHIADLNQQKNTLLATLRTATPDSLAQMPALLSETTELWAAPHAGPLLLRLAGAGMLAELFEFRDWEKQDPRAALALHKQLKEILPPYHHPQLAVVDLVWAMPKMPMGKWETAALPRATLGSKAR